MTDLLAATAELVAIPSLSHAEGPLAALVEQRNVEEAARVTNLSPQTLYRWKKIPEFEAAYNEALLAIYRQALARTR